MHNEITQEQLEKIKPMVDRFLAPFRELELAIPLHIESALSYELQPENAARLNSGRLSGPGEAGKTR
ncbi:MAG: hypothetical protein M3Z32_11110 [Acidobacteriota bacterium]|nr:hypothetical protein [Acidobacteriota bacterium]